VEVEEEWWSQEEGASDIDLSSCYSLSSSSDEKEWHKGKWSSKNINSLCFAAQDTQFWSWMTNLEIIVWVINRTWLNFWPRYPNPIPDTLWPKS
jgi:hypothetical protein